MDLNARVDVNCERKDGRTENPTPISHLAKAGATKINVHVRINQHQLLIARRLLEEGRGARLLACSSSCTGIETRLMLLSFRP